LLERFFGDPFAPLWHCFDWPSEPPLTVDGMYAAARSHSFIRPLLVASTLLLHGAAVCPWPGRGDAGGEVTDAGPRLVHGAIADLLVRVEGQKVCSGTPITGTLYVVTAAHCVLGSDAARVVRGGVTYTADAVLADDRYLDAPRVQFDAAVLVMDQVVSGPSTTVGSDIPDTGALTIAGLQPLDSDGTLLRGANPHDRPDPDGASGTLVRIASAPAGCTVPSAALSLTASQVDVPCGLIPGASGGGLFAPIDGRIELVGIISTVTFDQSINGTVPLTSLHELLQHPETYVHELTARPPATSPRRLS
jgi:hypothetical protein